MILIPRESFGKEAIVWCQFIFSSWGAQKLLDRIYAVYSFGYHRTLIPAPAFDCPAKLLDLANKIIVVSQEAIRSSNVDHVLQEFCFPLLELDIIHKRWIMLLL